MSEHSTYQKKPEGDKNPGYYRVSLESVWDGGSEELEGTLRALRVLRARRSAELELEEPPRFVVVDASLPLQEDIIEDDGLVLIREDRPPHLRGCVDIVSDQVAWNAASQGGVEEDGVWRHCEI